MDFLLEVGCVLFGAGSLLGVIGFILIIVALFQ